MARVPTWTELRLDVKKLVQWQKEYYESVHHLLDSAIPELDRKILSYSGKQDVLQPKSLDFITTNAKTKPRSIVRFTQHGDSDSRLPNSISMPNIPQPPAIQSKSKPGSRPEPDPPFSLALAPPVEEAIHPTRTKVSAAKKAHRAINVTTKNVATNFPTPKVSSQDFYSISNLEHLQPLPLPLSEYLKRNRPEVVRNAECRASQIKRKSLRRKHLLSTKIINSLEHIRLSSRSSSNYQLNNNKTNQNFQQTYREYNAPTYSVRCKLSEYEMKKLTAKTYKRLPEVKRKRKEEVTNHMRVQNYKNRQEYGRKLLENRRIGIIDYPLRSSSYDDRSITSSQSDFSMNGYVRASDSEFG